MTRVRWQVHGWRGHSGEETVGSPSTEATQNCGGHSLAVFRHKKGVPGQFQSGAISFHGSKLHIR
jgi:hypothetical protein